MNSFADILQYAGKGFQKEIRDTLKRKEINASGRLSDSVQYEVKQKGFTFTLEVTAFSYIFSALQEGRKPSERGNEPPQLFPKIVKWIKQKPIPFDKNKISLQGLAYVITRSIHERGTKLWKEFGSKGRTTGELERIFSDEEIDKIEKDLIKVAEQNISEGFIKFSGR